MPGLATVSVVMLVLQLQGVVQGTVSGTPQISIPARDQRPVRRTGTGVIRGRVVDGVSGQALVHAQIRLSGAVPGIFAVTDASGTFTFSSLPSGRYSMFVNKPGYLPTTYPESQRTVRGTSNAIILADGQEMERVTVPLYRGGAVIGRVVDAWGDPLEYTDVRAVRVRSSRDPRVRGGMSGSSNDAGEFRIGRLESGTYLIVATPRMSRGFGGMEEDAEPTAPVPTYYPGVLSPDQAQPIIVERGQAISGIDFQVLEQSVTTVAGTVLDSDGQPAIGGGISVQTWGNGGTNTRSGAQIRPNGTFELKLPPGEYRLIATLVSNDESKRAAAAGQPIAPRPMWQATNASQESGMLRLTVASEPLVNVVINTGRGGTISGRLTFEGDLPPIDPARIRIGAQTRRVYESGGTIGENGEECRSSGPGTTVNADLTFTLENVRGACVINVSTADSRWRPKSVIYRGTDLLDRPIDLSNGQHARDVQVVLSSRSTVLSAEVTDDRGANAQEYVLLAFSTDRSRWPLARYVSFAWSFLQLPSTSTTTSTPMTPTTATATPSASRQSRPVTVRFLPPGEYYAVAIDDAAYEEIHDPAFLEQLVPSATRVTLREGEPQTLQLRRIKRPPSEQ